MKRVKSDYVVSKTLLEVLEWKESVYEEMKDKSFEERKRILSDAMIEAASILKAQLVKKEDGSYRFV